MAAAGLVAGLVGLVVFALWMTGGEGGAGEEHEHEAPSTAGHSTSGAAQVGALELSEVRADLGTVPLGVAAVHEFRLRNAGDEPLALTLDHFQILTLEGC